MDYKYGLGTEVVLVDGGTATVERVILQHLAPQPVYHVAFKAEDVHDVVVVAEDQIERFA